MPAPRLPGAAAGAPSRHRSNLSVLADRCSTLRSLALVHAAMLVSGRLAADAFAASRLVASYAALSPPATVLRLLSSLPYTPNSFMLNTTLRALASSPDPASAVSMFSDLRRAAGSYSPGKHTLPCLLKASARLPLPVSQQLHALAVKYGFALDTYVANGLVRAYSVAGAVRAAQKVFDELPEKAAVVYTTMVSGYAQNGSYANAIAAFDDMVSEGIAPGPVALASVLSACARSGSGGLAMGRRVHDIMEDRGMTAPAVGTILGTALVDMYAKNGAIEEAVKVFEGMPERNTATWNALISGFAHHDHGEDAVALFRRMRQEGARPNASTLVGVLSAYCHAGLLDDARRVFASMEEDFGVTPGIQHYGCMVDLLGRSGLLAEAEEMIRGMPCEADNAIWGALLTACKNQGDIDVAERAVQEMLKLDPGNHGVYVVLSNIYADAGRWQDVDRLRKVMKGARLSKIPGSSAVGGGDG